jgi:hypothetical protein
VRGIDWQNRPTFQQAVHFTRHRPFGTAVVRRPTVPDVVPDQLPRTGLGLGLPLAATLVVGLAGVLALRRRSSEG